MVLEFTIFIKRSIIIIAGGDEKTSCISSKICSSMVLVPSNTRKRLVICKFSTYFFQIMTLNCIFWRKQKQIYHVIVEERAIILHKSSHCKSQVFSRSVRNRSTILCIPEGFNQKTRSSTKNYPNKILTRSVLCTHHLPASPCFSPHFWLVWPVGTKTFAVETVTSIYL